VIDAITCLRYQEEAGMGGGVFIVVGAEDNESRERLAVIHNGVSLSIWGSEKTRIHDKFQHLGVIPEKGVVATHRRLL